MFSLFLSDFRKYLTDFDKFNSGYYVLNSCLTIIMHYFTKTFKVFHKLRKKFLFRRDRVVCLATRLHEERSWFRNPADRLILFSFTFIPTLEPPSLRIQYVSGSFPVDRMVEA